MGALLALKALPWKLIGLAALGMFIGGLFLALKMEQSQNAKLKAQLHECSSLRAQDRTNYIAAQKAADEKAKQNVQRVTNEQQRIRNEVSSDYARQLADLRARFDRLHPHSPTAPGKPQGPGVSPNGQAAGGADDLTGERLSPSERQIAAEISLRLKALQDWVTRTMNVDPNR